jgi:hypothetical protein
LNGLEEKLEISIRDLLKQIPTMDPELIIRLNSAAIVDNLNPSKRPEGIVRETAERYIRQLEDALAKKYYDLLEDVKVRMPKNKDPEH